MSIFFTGLQWQDGPVHCLSAANQTGAPLPGTGA